MVIGIRLFGFSRTLPIVIATDIDWFRARVLQTLYPFSPASLRY
jgi:hypothetical protein